MNSDSNTAKALNSELSNYAGDNLDPVLSLRNSITLYPHSSQTVYVVVGFGRSKEQINEILKVYNNKRILEREFDISTLMNVIETKNMGITGEDMRTYNIMLNYIYQTTL